MIDQEEAIVIPARIIRMGSRFYASIPKNFQELAERARRCAERGECKVFVIAVHPLSFEAALGEVIAERQAEEASVPEPIEMSLRWAKEYGERLAKMVHEIRSRKVFSEPRQPEDSAESLLLDDTDHGEEPWGDYTLTSS